MEEVSWDTTLKELKSRSCAWWVPLIWSLMGREVAGFGAMRMTNDD